jgi:membrane-associated phospholipid phosphatase
MTWAADARVLGTLAAVGWIMSRGGDRRQRLVANHVAISLTAAVMLPKIMKRVIDRTRPDRVVVGRDRRGVGTSGQPHDSFPSGHSVHIGAIVSALSWAYPKKAAVFLAIGGALAATRVAVLAHWTTDVVLGLTLGAAIERAARRVSGARRGSTRA